MSQVRYKETQRFSKSDILLLLGAFVLFGVFRIVQELVQVQPDYSRLTILTGGVLLFSGLIWYLRKLRLTARYNEKNIKLKLSPFGLRQRKIKWKDVIEARIIEYSPAFVWSGWNVHFDSWHKIFNLSGDSLLQLRLNSGEEISIGCCSREELETFLAKAHEYNPNLSLTQEINW